VAIARSLWFTCGLKPQFFFNICRLFNGNNVSSNILCLLCCCIHCCAIVTALQIPPAPPRPDFDASREKLQKLGEGEGTMTKEEFNKMKQELEA
jgi:hypothetical protein